MSGTSIVLDFFLIRFCSVKVDEKGEYLGKSMREERSKFLFVNALIHYIVFVYGEYK
jgi:hypothetical protein